MIDTRDKMRNACDARHYRVTSRFDEKAFRSSLFLSLFFFYCIPQKESESRARENAWKLSACFCLRSSERVTDRRSASAARRNVFSRA